MKRKDYPVRVPKALLDRIRGLARANGRTMASQIEAMMNDGDNAGDGPLPKKYQGKMDAWVGVPANCMPEIKARAARDGRTIGGQLTMLLS
jgi:hypothetical protein